MAYKYIPVFSIQMKITTFTQLWKLKFFLYICLKPHIK